MVCHWNSRINNVTRNVNIDILRLSSFIKNIRHNSHGKFSMQYRYTQIAEKIRTITNSKNRDSCRNLLKKLNILTFISVFVSNREQYITKSDIHGRHTRYGSDIHQTIANLSLNHRGSYHMGLMDINSLPWKELIKHAVVVQRLKWCTKESCIGSEVERSSNSML